MTRPLPLNLETVAEFVGGDLTGGRLVRVTSFAIDSRRVGPGAVFIALPGQRTDGHLHLEEAARQGAAAAIVSRSDVASGLPLIRVTDTARALQKLGEAFRSRWPLTVVGITGSAGKTTTKELAAEVIGASFCVFRSEGNLNNLIGLPLTLTRRRPEHEVAVLEMGMSTPGELAALSRLVRPDVALITNIGRAHQQNFKDLRAIAAAKAEILEGLGEGGIFVANADDPLVMELAARRHRGPLITFGESGTADVRGSDFASAADASTTFTLTAGGASKRLRIAMPGRHQVRNGLAALAVASAVGLDPLASAEILETKQPGEGRGRLIALGQGVLLLDDTYNANPEAVAAAVRALPPGARRVAVLGDMLELGAAEEAAHREVGALVAELGYTLVVAVGPRARLLAAEASARGVPEVVEIDDAAAAARALPDLVQAGDAVLVKGSRGVGLEVVVGALRDRLGAP